MDVMTNIVVSVLTFVAGLLTNVLASDICRSADRVCTKIIGRAARHLAAFDQKAVELEWLGDLSERETVWEKYHHAIGCYLVAGRMRREALTLTLAMSFRVTSVGTVPLTLRLGPPLVVSGFFAATNPKMPRWLSRAVTTAFILYMFAKLFLSARRLGPGSLHQFIDEFKNFKRWQYEAHVVRKGIDLNLSKIFAAMVRDHTKIPQIAIALTDIFQKKTE